MSIALLQHVLQLLLVEAITGPVWWYTSGLHWMIRWMRDRAARTWYQLAISLWLHNIMVPMFGQYDWQGRIISFFIRLFQVIARTIAFVFALLWYFFVVVVWCVAPLFVLYCIFAPLFS